MDMDMDMDTEVIVYLIDQLSPSYSYLCSTVQTGTQQFQDAHGMVVADSQ